MTKINQMIIDELLTYSENVYYVIKPMGTDTDNYIVYNFWFEEDAWSNDTAEFLFVDVSIAVIDKDLKQCLKLVRKIEHKTDYNRIASYFDDDTMEWIFLLNKDFLVEVEE